jgi:hypothetical protein
MPPVGDATALFGVRACRVYRLTADTGASPTYGPAVVVPGINTIGLDPNLVTAELRGDDQIIAKKGRVDRVNFNFQHGRLSLPALAVMFGGQVEDQGTRKEYAFTTAGLPYFKIEAKIEDVEDELDVGDVHVVLWKCQITGGTLIQGQQDQFSLPTETVEAIVPQATEWQARREPARVKFFDEPTALSA